MSNSHHLQNYYDHHLHAIYVLVLFDWCHFVWNFPYGFIVHIFVNLNGSTAMCWAEAIVYLTISDSSPVGVCSLKLFCGAHLWKKCLHELVGFLCFLKSARWTYIPADGLARPEDDAFSARPRLSQLGPTVWSLLYSCLLSWEYTSPVCGTPLGISMDKPYSL